MQVVINSILANYEVYGEPNRPYLLVLHGWKRDITDWRRVAQALSKSHYVVLLDLPGFGGTTQPKTNYGTYEYADFVTAFLRKLEIPKVSVLGHSFGGRICIILGARSPAIEKLILVDSAGTNTINPILKYIVLAVKPLLSVLPNVIANKVRQLLSSQDFLQAGSMKDIFKKVISEDLTHLLGLIQSDSLVVWGSEDKVLNVNNTKVFHQRIPNNIVRIVWGAGHHPHIDKEEVFIEIIEEFLHAK